VPEQPPDSVDLLLASLPILDRQIYVLHALEGFSWQEAAAVLGKLPAEVNEIFQRASRDVAAALRASHPAQPGNVPA